MVDALQMLLIRGDNDNFEVLHGLPLQLAQQVEHHLRVEVLGEQEPQRSTLATAAATAGGEEGGDAALERVVNYVRENRSSQELSVKADTLQLLRNNQQQQSRWSKFP